MLKKGFVIGKFNPLHKGHLALFEFAFKKCDFLSIVVCCSDKEKIDAETRKSWISSSLSDNSNVEIIPFNYLESELPNTSESSLEVSKKWATIFQSFLADHSCIISSEPYGQFVADFMNIENHVFDIDRKTTPISASSIKKNFIQNWHFLPTSVQVFFSIKIVVLGTESTGKTTLCSDLSRYFNGKIVQEAGRELIPDSTNFTLKDLEKVAKKHAEEINLAMSEPSLITLIDTDIHTTLSYSNFTFKTEFDVDDKAYQSNKADCYLYLCNDVPFVQDGTRLSEEERNLLDNSHRNTLRKYGIEYNEIKGNWNDRLKQAIQIIQDQVDKKINLLERS